MMRPGAIELTDAAPIALDHLRQDGMGQLALPREVEGHRLVPAIIAGIDRQGPAAARAIDQDLDLAERPHRLVADALRRGRLHEIGGNQGRAWPLRRDDLLGEFLEQRPAARHRGKPHPLRREPARDRPADAHAGARDKRGSPMQLQIHRFLPFLWRCAHRTAASRDTAPAFISPPAPLWGITASTFYLEFASHSTELDR
jgi:hypothetical protein